MEITRWVTLHLLADEMHYTLSISIQATYIVRCLENGCLQTFWHGNYRSINCIVPVPDTQYKIQLVMTTLRLHSRHHLRNLLDYSDFNLLVRLLFAQTKIDIVKRGEQNTWSITYYKMRLLIKTLTSWYTTWSSPEISTLCQELIACSCVFEHLPRSPYPVISHGIH